MIRAGLVVSGFSRLGGWLIDPRIAYVSTDQQADSPFLASYEVLDMMRAPSSDSVRTYGAHDVGTSS